MNLGVATGFVYTDAGRGSFERVVDLDFLVLGTDKLINVNEKTATQASGKKKEKKEKESALFFFHL